jgi:hypothetical protein
MPQAAPVLATEAAVATTMTAAEIAAAQAAATHAAQVAAAQTLAAEQAAALAAQQATAATATNAATSGIQTLAQEVATAPPAGIETLNMGQVPTTISNVPGLSPETLPGLPPEISKLASDANALTNPMTRADFLSNSFAGPAVNTNFIPPSPTLYGSATPPVSPSMGTNFLPDIIPPADAVVQPVAPTIGTGYEINQPLNNSLGVDATTGTGMRSELTSAQTQLPSQGLNYSSPLGTPPAAKPGMVEEFMNMSLPNKLLTGMIGATGYEMLNKPKPYEKEKYKSTFKPGLYTGYTPVQPTPYQPQYAGGGLADLGGYSDGGRMLKGPGDGMSDDIPATIANKQPARLANEEFVIPADVVSHLGNGSSEAGAKQLYKMMDRIRKARTGTKKQGKQINPEKYLA